MYNEKITRSYFHLFLFCLVVFLLFSEVSSVKIASVGDSRARGVYDFGKAQPENFDLNYVFSMQEFGENHKVFGSVQRSTVHFL